MTGVRIEVTQEREGRVVPSCARDVTDEEINEGTVRVGAEPGRIAAPELRGRAQEVAILEVMIVERFS